MTSMMMRYTSTIRIPLFCYPFTREHCANSGPVAPALIGSPEILRPHSQSCNAPHAFAHAGFWVKCCLQVCGRRAAEGETDTAPIHTNSLNKHQQHQAKQGREKWNAHRSTDCSMILAHRAARSSLIHRALSLPPDICHGVSVCGSGRRVRSTRGAYAAHTPHVQTTHFSLFGNSSPTK